MQHKTTSAPHPPLISCLMVTQQGRINEVKQAIKCYVRQQIAPIELVIIHDSDTSYNDELLCLIESYPDENIQVFQAPPGHTLGWLRNRTLEHANAELVCQWDDDDFSHPARLKTQYELMQNENTEFCFMTDQLHLFTAQRFLFWDDRSTRQSPYDLIENTMLGKRELICKYPDLARGEDTAILEDIFRKQHKVSRLHDHGWLYTYVFNGKNTWDFKHHSEISLHQRLNTDELLARRVLLEHKLMEYHFPFECIDMPHEKGKIAFKL